MNTPKSSSSPPQTVSRLSWRKGEMGGVERPTVKPEVPSPTSEALTVTGGSTVELVVVAMEFVKSGVWLCETPKDTGGQGVM